MQSTENINDHDKGKTLKGLAKIFSFTRGMKYRNRVDSAWKYSITFGGVSIIAAVLLIMFFLFYVVQPMFDSASISSKAVYDVPGNTHKKTLFYTLDEYKETGIRLDESGGVTGFNVQTGEVIFSDKLELSGATIVSSTAITDAKKLMAFGLSNGQVLIAEFDFKLTYPIDVRVVVPQVLYPFGSEGFQIASGAIEHLSSRMTDSELVIVAKEAGSNEIQVAKFDKVESMMSDDIELELSSENSFAYSGDLSWMKLGVNGRNLYLIQRSGKATFYNIANINDIQNLQTVFLTDVANQETISTVEFLLGSFSLLVGTDQGRIVQWFPVRGEDNLVRLQQVRSFSTDSSITFLNIEHARKGFASLNVDNELSLFHTTSQRNMLNHSLPTTPNLLQITPRADGILLEYTDGKVELFDLINKHPEVSMSSLWGEVWYEGYSEPDYVWQSSSASSDFEPKFSMMPLTFGTIKAAFYAMLFAVPIAIFAAIYTAFFMDKKTRTFIKPSIELIEALPTVILGFLAGLWLAPHMEANLSGFFAFFVIIPLGIILVGFAFSRLPDRIRMLVPVGSRSLLMIPVILGLGWLAMALDNPLQDMFFDGDMRHWLTASAGIDFDQRNAMVIGFAMGFALIPTIFSVAEDAIYNVPSYLVNGSLALGASGWQTVVGVVLPTASPGIFSAIMLGFGRGVGETMIVLMASGNTPLMDVNLFEGMRTLSANLAVEMGETELYSTHYRVLFLSGLLLFVFTFIFNTIAEVVRERMRKRYGSL